MQRGSCLTAAALLGSWLIAGCGGGSMQGGSHGTGPVAGETTKVTLVLSSTANDQLTIFDLFLNSLTLTDLKGNTVNLVATPQNAEFMHLNGGAEPFVTVDVPQAVYKSATAEIGTASFTCEVLQGNSLTNSTYAYGYTPQAQVTVNLPDGVVIDGSSMALLLQLQVSQSASFPSQCYEQGISQWSISPTFSLAPLTMAAQPTNWMNGRFTALAGMVQGPGQTAGSFTVNAADGAGSEITQGNALTSQPAVWSVNTDSKTDFEGVGNSDGLTAGMPVEFDGNLQPDGSLLATRVAVADPDVTNVTTISGPILFVGESNPVMMAAGRQVQGAMRPVLGAQYFSFGNATFATWAGMSNLASLPFTPMFSADTMVAGQMVSTTTHATTLQGGPIYVPLTTVMLAPQTINGMVVGTGTTGNFTTYTVNLAPYDLFPQFAVQGGQTTQLMNPSQVVVYTDSNTQMVTTPTTGSAARFTGLIFNDKGTLRMDCSSISAGVAE